MNFFRNLNGTFLSQVLFGSPTCWRWASPGEGYSRNASCALNLISTFLYRQWSRNCLSFQNTCNHPSIRSFWSIFRFLRSIWPNIVCWFFFTIVLSVRLRITDSDYPFGIFKLFISAKYEILNFKNCFRIVNCIN